MIWCSRFFMDGFWVTYSNHCQSQPLNGGWVSGNLPKTSFFLSAEMSFFTSWLMVGHVGPQLSCRLALSFAPRVTRWFFSADSWHAKGAVPWSSQRPLRVKALRKKVGPPSPIVVAAKHGESLWQDLTVFGDSIMVFPCSVPSTNENPESGPMQL